MMCNNYIISGEAEGVTNYYPFGMMHTIEYNTFDNPYLYKYNGKELQETGMYDYGARFYMPDIGRWGVVDPLAEASRRFTPYHYGNNNPVRFIDPYGRLTMDNLHTYNPGSAVADFINKNGFGDDYLPMFYRDDAGVMIVNQSLGNDGQGGGGNIGLSANSPGSVNSLLNYFNSNGITSNSIDLLYQNYDSNKGISTWWFNGASGFGNLIQELVGYQIRLSQGLSDNWYGWGGKGNWAFGAGAALSGVKGTLNSERMYGEGIRRGLSGNYVLKGRNLSQFRTAPMTSATVPISNVGRWAGIAGKASFGFGVAMDGIGVWNYTQDKTSKNAVHPAKAGLNTAMGAYGLTGAGTIPAILYFGIDAFYPGGWEQAAIDQDRLYQENKAINPNWQMYPGAMKQ